MELRCQPAVFSYYVENVVLDDNVVSAYRTTLKEEEVQMNSIIFTVIGIATAGLLWLFFKPPFGKNITRISTDQRIVALTFDDGPNPPYTDQLLDVLAKHDIKATFFLIGNRIEKHLETVRRIIAAGHHIGNHTYTHPALGFCLPTRIQQEIERTDNLLRRIGIKSEIVFRAPMLTRYLPVAWVQVKNKRTHISCNVWGWDWLIQNPDRITRNVLKKVKQGSIIVLHDGIARIDNANCSGTIEAADRIITRLKQQGYQFVTVQHLLENL